MRASEYFPDILSSRICYGLRKPEDALPTLGDQVVPLLGETCLIVYAQETMNDVIKRWREKGESTAHLSGGLPNPMTMSIQFGFQKREFLRTRPFSEHIIGDIQKSIDGILSLPLCYDYPGAVKRSVELTGEERFKQLYGCGLSDYLNMSIERSRAINIKDAFPLDWELLTFPQGQRKVLSRTTWLTKYGYSAGHGSSVIYCGHPFEGEDIKISFVVGDRGHGTAAGNLLLIGLSKGADELEQQFRMTYRRMKNQDPAQLTTNQFVNSAMDVGEKINKKLERYTPPELTEMVFAVPTNVHDGVVDKIGTYFDFLAEDMFVRTADSNEWKQTQ